MDKWHFNAIGEKNIKIPGTCETGYVAENELWFSVWRGGAPNVVQ